MAQRAFNEIQLLSSSSLSRFSDKGSINRKLSESNRNMEVGSEGWNAAPSWEGGERPKEPGWGIPTNVRWGGRSTPHLDLRSHSRRPLRTGWAKARPRHEAPRVLALSFSLPTEQLPHHSHQQDSADGRKHVTHADTLTMKRERFFFFPRCEVERYFFTSLRRKKSLQVSSLQNRCFFICVYIQKRRQPTGAAFLAGHYLQRWVFRADSHGGLP